MDDTFTVIGTLILRSKFPPSIIRIASSMDPYTLECIDEINNNFLIPIMGYYDEFYNEQFNYYTKNFGFPMPI